MFVSIPLIALALSLLTFAAAVISWFAARQAKKDRAVNETVPQLQAVIFGPQDQVTKLPKREEGLQAKVEELERANLDLQKRARRNRKQLERMQAFILEMVSPGAPGNYRPEDTGQYRALVAKLTDLDEPGDSDPPEP